jgi:hypothetical protein
MATTGLTPLLHAFLNANYQYVFLSDLNHAIDMLRHIFEVSGDIDDFGTWRWRRLRISFSCFSELTNWLWDHVMSNFSGSELLTFQTAIFRSVVQDLGEDIHWHRACTTLRTLAPKMAKSNLLLDEILTGNIDALECLWASSRDIENESQKSGSRYIALLRSLSVDFKRSIESGLEKLYGRTLQDVRGGVLDRKILFYQDDGQAWVLRWEWILNEETPGYNLLSEFPSMTFDGTRYSYDSDWPFFTPNRNLPDDDHNREGPKWDARRARRLAKTARKELARTGQKRPRSRMPGAWI